MDEFVPYLLTTLGYQLPHLLAAAAALGILAVSAPPAPGRVSALWGAGLLVFTVLASMLISAWQGWLMFNGGSISSILPVISFGHLLLSVIGAVGVVMLAWGGCKAMQAARSSG